jgi:dihydrofolate synthase/folylpolyglutamate synthase
MNYEDALAAIQFKGAEGSILRLDTMDVLLGASGRPQDGMKVIHVAGTNGKGSTSQFIYSILIDAGYKVGLYQSPSMVSFNERIQVNRELISDADWIEIADELRGRLEGDGVGVGSEVDVAPTEFEWITAIAFHYFKREQCDFVILEVGLGGRLDATNVVDKPLVSVITKIGLDHQDFLGETIEEISREKAGIIKTGSPVVLYPLQEDGVYETIKEECSTVGYVDLIVPDVSRLVVSSVSDQAGVFDYGNLDRLQIRMLGVHQFYNAVTSLEVVRLLVDRYDVDVSETAVRQGLLNARMIGRFDLVSQDPVVILDGAHNPQGVESLYESIKQLYPVKSVIAVIGVLKDKNLAAMIQIMDELVASYQLVIPNNDRRFAMDEMARIVAANSDGKAVSVNDTLAGGFDAAFEQVDSDSIIVCFGSLYLVAEAYELFNK